MYAPPPPGMCEDNKCDVVFCNIERGLPLNPQRSQPANSKETHGSSRARRSATRALLSPRIFARPMLCLLPSTVCSEGLSPALHPPHWPLPTECLSCFLLFVVSPLNLQDRHRRSGPVRAFREGPGSPSDSDPLASPLSAASGGSSGVRSGAALSPLANAPMPAGGGGGFSPESSISVGSLPDPTSRHRSPSPVLEPLARRPSATSLAPLHGTRGRAGSPRGLPSVGGRGGGGSGSASPLPAATADVFVFGGDGGAEADIPPLEDAPVLGGVNGWSPQARASRRRSSSVGLPRLPAISPSPHAMPGFMPSPSPRAGSATLERSPPGVAAAASASAAADPSPQLRVPIRTLRERLDAVGVHNVHVT
jgi:hypothetical protein